MNHLAALLQRVESHVTTSTSLAVDQLTQSEALGKIKAIRYKIAMSKDRYAYSRLSNHGLFRLATELECYTLAKPFVSLEVDELRYDINDLKMKPCQIVAHLNALAALKVKPKSLYLKGVFTDEESLLASLGEALDVFFIHLNRLTLLDLPNSDTIMDLLEKNMFEYLKISLKAGEKEDKRFISRLCDVIRNAEVQTFVYYSPSPLFLYQVLIDLIGDLHSVPQLVRFHPLKYDLII